MVFEYPVSRETLLSAMNLSADDYGEAVGHIAKAMNQCYKIGKNSEHPGQEEEKELRKLLKKTYRKNEPLFSPRRKEMLSALDACTPLFINAYRKGCEDRKKGVRV